MLYVSLLAFRVHYPSPEDWIYLTECLTGYGLGGSSIAMFGRVGGGIYTKAADGTLVLELLCWCHSDTSSLFESQADVFDLIFIDIMLALTI